MVRREGYAGDDPAASSPPEAAPTIAVAPVPATLRSFGRARLASGGSRSRVADQRGFRLPMPLDEAGCEVFTGVRSDRLEAASVATAPGTPMTESQE